MIPPVFSGRGAAFNVMENNTSCFFLHANGNMLLIDCGSTVFKEMASQTVVLDENHEIVGFGAVPRQPGDRVCSLFDLVDKLFVYITHTHGDHVGSLATLVDYFHGIKQKPVMLVASNEEMKRRLTALLSSQNAFEDHWTKVEDLPMHFPDIQSSKSLPLKHTSDMNSLALVLDVMPTDAFPGGILFYTGDTSDENAVKKFLTENHSTLYRAYIDASTVESPAHLSMTTLGVLVTEEVPAIANKIHCMHINGGVTCEEYQSHADQYGFNVVKTWDVKTRDIDNNAQASE